MGTRHQIAIQINGEYKVAQYGQWDGYPSGQGLDVLEFFRDQMDEKIFVNNLKNVYPITKQEYDKLFPCGIDDDLKKLFPEFSRDTSWQILPIIQRGNCFRIVNQITFAADSLFCEWAYVIDFDKRTFEVYQGFNKEPLTPEDRFYELREYEELPYHGVKLVKSWSLDELPTNEEFVSALEKEDEEE